jgi:hypothetical protein
MTKAGVPESFRQPKTKPEIAIEEIDRIAAAGVRFGCVLADAGYGLSAPFPQAMSARGFCWAVCIPKHQKVYLPTCRWTPRRTSGFWRVADFGGIDAIMKQADIAFSRAETVFARLRVMPMPLASGARRSG